MLISNGGTAFFYRCEKCLMPCEPKPLPSEPKCEHDRGDYWWDGPNPDAVYRKETPDEKCPICKPVIEIDPGIGESVGYLVHCIETSTVEPSVEAFDAGLIQEIYDYCDYIRNSSGVARTICELIEERKNERNRHG